MEATSSIGLKDFGSTGVNVSTGRCGVGMIVCTNGSGATAFFQFFDAAISSVSVGSTTPTFVIAVANGTTESLTPSVGEMFFPTRLSVAATTAIFGTTATANGHHVSVWFN